MKSILITLTTILLTLSVAGCTKKEPSTPTEKTPPAAKPAETNDTPTKPETTPETPAAEPAPTPEKTPAAEPEKPAAEESMVRKAAPLEGLTYIKGDPVTFKEGKAYVVEFWATWCPPCKKSIPHLTELQKQYKDKGVTIIGISNEKELETVKTFVTDKGDEMDYTVAWDPDRKADAAYMKAYDKQGIPTAFIVDGKGNVVWVGHPLDGMDEVLGMVVAGNFDAEAYAKEKAAEEARQKELYQLYKQYFADVTNGKSLDEARPTAEKLIEIGPAEALNAMAWNILSLDPEQSDIKIALKAAENAVTQTKSENPMVLDTYALALFKNGKIAEAVAAQEKAVALSAGNEQMQADLKTRLEEYTGALKQTEDK